MPTENRSSSNHGTRTFTLDSLTVALEQVQALHEISADLIAESVFGQPAQQQQSEPVAWLAKTLKGSLAGTLGFVRPYNRLNPDLYEGPFPVFRHADTAEVEQLRADVVTQKAVADEAWAEVDKCRENARAIVRESDTTRHEVERLIAQCLEKDARVAEMDRIGSREIDTLRAQLAEAQALLRAIAGWTEETRAAVLEAFQDELNESASYEWYDSAIADLMKLIQALPASAESSAPVERNDRASWLNDWFLSLEPGRQAVLREDKWMLANAAFEAGYARATLTPKQ